MLHTHTHAHAYAHAHMHVHKHRGTESGQRDQGSLQSSCQDAEKPRVKTKERYALAFRLVCSLQ